MQPIDAMTTDALTSLLNDTDDRIRELDTLLRTTPADTLAYRAMQESYPGLMSFRHRLDDALDARGA